VSVKLDDLKYKLLFDRRFYIENLVLIPDKNRRPIPFKFNPIQLQLYEGLKEAKRAIVLKASQVGVTSLIVALFLVDCITKPNTTSVVIAHEEFITQRLLAKAKVFESSIPPELKPTMHHRSTYELAWEDIHSTFYIGSARSFVFGRGERIDNALCSEIAFWNDPERITIPLGERVPKEGTLIYESTPNGEDNFFYYEWRKAKGWQEGKSIFRPFFFPWWLNPEYAYGIYEGLPSDAHSPLEYSGEERFLVEHHGLTEQQIRWRRAKIAALGEMFKQEYPEDDETCFLQTREGVFDSLLLNEKAKMCYQPPASFNGAAVWYPPEDHHTYIIGADPSAGINDKAAAVVWDIKGLKLCARLVGHWDPFIFAEKLRELGHYYNDACLIIENNASGVAVLSKLIDYPNLYYQRDLITGKPTTRLGWATSAMSKTYMLNKFKQLLPDLTIHDIELIRQARAFRYQGFEIVSGDEDDILMAAMIGLAAKDTAIGAKGFRGIAGWKTW